MAHHPPIALFDSGVGGLTVYRAINSILPHESLIYLGDIARVPYGTKSQETITRYTLMAAGKLVEYGIKLLVVACNTATSAALPALQKKFFPIPVIGVVEPGARSAVEASKNGHIAVIATEATIKGGAYEKAIHKLWPDAIIASKACTLLVSLAEEGWSRGEIADSVARRYLGEIFTDNSSPDTLLLGCTHFPLFLDTLQNIVGANVRIVDSAGATARAVKRRLEESGNLAPGSNQASQRFLTTDNRERFARVGSLFLDQPIQPPDVELVDL